MRIKPKEDLGIFLLLLHQPVTKKQIRNFFVLFFCFFRNSKEKQPGTDRLCVFLIVTKTKIETKTYLTYLVFSHERNICFVLILLNDFLILGNCDIGEEDSTISASSVSDMQKPPDGGWGWFVVFASFMIHVLGK